MVDCPECDGSLRGDRCPHCGWQPTPAKVERPQPARPWERPLCDHVTEVGKMCGACEVYVAGLKRELRRSLAVLAARLESPSARSPRG
jgi:hypothetical protein